MSRFFLLFFLFIFPDTGLAQDPKKDWVYPIAVTSTEDGTLYVVDLDLPGVWKVAEGKRTLFFHGDKKFRTPLNRPRCAALDKEGNLLVGDSATREVYRFDAEGNPAPLTKGKIGIPAALAVQGDEIFVSDLESKRIYKIKEDGAIEEVLVIAAVRGLAFDKAGGLIVSHHGKDQLFRLSDSGERETLAKGRPFQFSHHLALDGDSILVVDGYAKCVWKVEPGKEPLVFAESESFKNPVGITKQGDHFVVVDPQAKSLFQVDATGKVTPIKLE